MTPHAPAGGSEHFPISEAVRHSQSTLPLVGPLAPVSSDRVHPSHPRVVQSVVLVEKAGALGERRVIEVEHSADLRVGRHVPTHDNVYLRDFGVAVLPESVSFEPADTRHDLCPGADTVHAELLAVVAVATKLDVGPDRQPARWVERRGQAEHAGGGVPVEHRARATDDVNPPDRPEVDVARLGRAVRRRDRNAVLDDRQLTQLEPRLRCADAETDATGETKVAPVLDEQTGNAPECLVGRRLTLRVVDVVPLHDGDRPRHGRQVLVGTGDDDGLRERGNRQRHLHPDRSARSDGHDGHVTGEAGKHGVHLVAPGHQVRDRVASPAIADSGLGATRAGVGRGHGDTGQHAAALAFDGATDGPRALTRTARRHAKDEHHRDHPNSLGTDRSQRDHRCSHRTAHDDSRRGHR